MPSYVSLKSVLRELYASSNGFDKLYVGKQVVYVLTKVAQTWTPVHNLESMLYKSGSKSEVCNNKLYMQRTSCRCGAQVQYKLT